VLKIKTPTESVYLEEEEEEGGGGNEQQRFPARPYDSE